MSFATLGLRQPILDAIDALGYETPSPIQAKAIPVINSGRDVLAAAQTGTGKTGGFVLPILEKLADGERAARNQVRSLILAPTRELAAQIGESVQNYSKHLQLSSFVVFGGVKINPQMMRLRRGADILVATPGRLIDLAQQNAVKFQKLEVLVLDEADRMLDMGFIHDIRRIMNFLPKRRQTLMFSATFSPEIKQLARTIVHQPEVISTSPQNSTATRVKQWMHPVDKAKKAALLTHLIVDNAWSQVLVFTRTKHGANKLTKYLENSGITAAAIHGNKSQGARTRALSEFKSGDVGVLVATDIAARGLDIEQLPQVVNYDLPSVAEDYVHRIGRTGRAGATGHAISLVCADEVEQLQSIEHFINALVDRKYIGGFEPKHEVPKTSLSNKKKKSSGPKKPKKNKNQGQRQDRPQDQGQKSGGRYGAKTKGKAGRNAEGKRANRSKNNKADNASGKANTKRTKPIATSKAGEQDKKPNKNNSNRNSGTTQKTSQKTDGAPKKSSPWAKAKPGSKPKPKAKPNPRPKAKPKVKSDQRKPKKP